MSQTIRKDAFKKIASILAGCEFIRCYKADDMSDDSGEVTAEEMIAAGRAYEFQRVYLSDDNSLTCVIHGNWSYTAYPTLELAEWRLTPQARDKYNLPARIAAKRERAEARKAYSRPLTVPATKQEGLANKLQLIINCIEGGDHHEALMQAVDLLDDVRCKSNPYRIGNSRERHSKPVSLAGCGNID
jgi:hypothetical protein